MTLRQTLVSLLTERGIDTGEPVTLRDLYEIFDGLNVKHTNYHWPHQYGLPLLAKANGCILGSLVANLHQSNLPDATLAAEKHRLMCRFLEDM